MSVNEQISGFLKAGLERSLPRERLKEVLHEAGWQDQVRRALGGFADVAFPIPSPARRHTCPLVRPSPTLTLPGGGKLGIYQPLHEVIANT